MAEPFGTIIDMHTCSVRWSWGTPLALSTRSPPSVGVSYGSVPFWKMGRVTIAWSSLNAGSGVPHARSPVACGQGEGAFAQSTQPVAVGAAAAATAVASAGPMTAGWPTVKTVASRTELGVRFCSCSHAR